MGTRIRRGAYRSSIVVLSGEGKRTRYVASHSPGRFEDVGDPLDLREVRAARQQVGQERMDQNALLAGNWMEREVLQSLAV